jgi:poly(A) polymerase
MGSITPDQAALEVVRRLHEAGRVAYFAGGCVRDRLMGVEPTDYDVATDAPPNVVIGMFRRSMRVGQSFGVVRVGLENQWVEVATFRSEGAYSDHRRPDQVQFSDAQHDARRRDFTINGLFYDPIADEVIDYVDGRADIDAKIIRAIGDPRTRFGEDYLRMLRAVRFSARLGFSLDDATARAIREYAPCLARISRERIGQELRMIFAPDAGARGRAGAMLHDLLLDAPILNEDHLHSEPKILTNLDPSTQFPCGLSAWALDRHLDLDRGGFAAAIALLKPAQIARRWRIALVLSNDETASLREILQTLQECMSWCEMSVARKKRCLARSSRQGALAVLHAAHAVWGDVGLNLQELERDVTHLTCEGVAPAPLVTGDDLVKAGLRPGPAFKSLLNHIYDAQLEGRITSREQGIELARQIASN